MEEQRQSYWTIGPACGASARLGARGFKEASLMLGDFSARASAGYLCFMAVADGFGGPGLGEAASRGACEAVHDAMDPNRYEDGEAFRRASEGELAAAVSAADASLRGADPAPGGEPVGTTLTCAAIDAENAFVAHVGNGRAYVLTARGTRQVTSDHVEISPGGAKRLTRALGVPGSAEPDLLRVPLRPGEVFFLCSHGVYSAVSAEEMTGAFMSSPDLQIACDWLAETAAARGASGDIMVAAWRVPGDIPVVAMKPPPAGPEEAPAKKGGWRRRALVALFAVLFLLGGTVGGWFIGSIFYRDKGVSKKRPATSSTARFSVGDVLAVDTTGRPEACYLADYPGGPDQTRLYDGCKVKVVSEKFSGGEQWYQVEVMDGGLPANGREGYVRESFLVESSPSLPSP